MAKMRPYVETANIRKTINLNIKIGTLNARTRNRARSEKAFLCFCQKQFNDDAFSN